MSSFGASSPALLESIHAELAQEVSPGALALSAKIVERYGDCVAAVLFYGSCLRDATDEDRVLDLYVLVDSYRAAHGLGVSALGNFFLPPNVYYLEAEAVTGKVRAKYAVVTTRAFERRTTSRAFHPYFWARFAQPSALVYARDDQSRQRVASALAGAFITMAEKAAPLLPSGGTVRDLWLRAFTETYRTELRAERPGRAEALFESYATRYEKLTTPPAQHVRSSVLAALLGWWGRRVVGKVLSVLRLMKSSFTFSGGADYILWKIEQHSGVDLGVTPWQKRHPIVASPILLWRGLRRGAFR